MPKISIIIPIYKAEKYLQRCLDSILNQSFTDYEVILVDDGSPDRSGEICEEYTQRDKRFRVFHKENGGVSSARQVGIEHARGTYSIQFDPDDWVESDMLSLMYEKMITDNADFVVCNMFMDHPSKTVIVSHDNRPKDINIIYDYFLTGTFPASLANKLIRHDLYKEKNFSFDCNVTRWEDTQAVCTLMYGSERVSFVDKPLYHYDFHSNPNSLARNTTLSGLKSQILVCDYFFQRLKGTIHETAVDSIRKSTKALAYNILNSEEYIKLYSNYNKDVLIQGISGKLGISGFFWAITILTQLKYPQLLYHKLQNLHNCFLFNKTYDNTKRVFVKK